MALDEPMQCLRCGYDLGGLPAAGRCPECGEAYDLGTGRGVRDARIAAIERGDRFMRRLRTLAPAGASALLLLAGLVTQLITGRGFWPAAFIAGVLALAALTSWVADRSDRAGRW